VGYGFLMEAPWNVKYEWAYRADNWEDLINKLKEYIRKEI
jgi:hypothetical protein